MWLGLTFAGSCNLMLIFLAACSERKYRLVVRSLPCVLPCHLALFVFCVLRFLISCVRLFQSDHNAIRFPLSLILPRSPRNDHFRLNLAFPDVIPSFLCSFLTTMGFASPYAMIPPQSDTIDRRSQEVLQCYIIGVRKSVDTSVFPSLSDSR